MGLPFSKQTWLHWPCEKGVLFACSGHSRGRGKVIPNDSRIGLMGSEVI